eukprot:703967-Hanusia_phi.AAC.1
MHRSDGKQRMARLFLDLEFDREPLRGEGEGDEREEAEEEGGEKVETAQEHVDGGRRGERLRSHPTEPVERDESAHEAGPETWGGERREQQGEERWE